MEALDTSSDLDDLLSGLEHRFGNVMGQAIFDHLQAPPPTSPPQCIEVIQLSEIAHRLRHHLYTQIAQHRALRHAHASVSAQNIRLLQERQTDDRAVILQTFQLYRQINHSFHALYQKCMAQTTKTKKQTNATVWVNYDAKDQSQNRITN